MEIRHILEATSQVTGVSRGDLLGGSRNREVCDARHIAAWCIYTNCQKTHEQIGAIFNRNHATALHSIRTANTFRNTDKNFRAKLDAVLASAEKRPDRTKRPWRDTARYWRNTQRKQVEKKPLPYFEID